MEHERDSSCGADVFVVWQCCNNQRDTFSGKCGELSCDGNSYKFRRQFERNSSDNRSGITTDVSPDVSQDIQPETSPDVTPKIPVVDITAEEVLNVTDVEIVEKFSNTESLPITGNVENLNEILDRIAEVTETKTLDLSKIESLNLSGNISAKTVTLTENVNLSECNAESSANESVDLNGNTNLSTLNLRNCANLTTLKCAECFLTGANLEGGVNLEEADPSGNSFTKFDAGADVFPKMRELECRRDS